jgi:hypothetical protein
MAGRTVPAGQPGPEGLWSRSAYSPGNVGPPTGPLTSAMAACSPTARTVQGRRYSIHRRVFDQGPVLGDRGEWARPSRRSRGAPARKRIGRSRPRRPSKAGPDGGGPDREPRTPLPLGDRSRQGGATCGGSRAGTQAGLGWRRIRPSLLAPGPDDPDGAGVGPAPERDGPPRRLGVRFRSCLPGCRRPSLGLPRRDAARSEGARRARVRRAISATKTHAHQATVAEDEGCCPGSRWRLHRAQPSTAAGRGLCWTPVAVLRPAACVAAPSAFRAATVSEAGPRYRLSCARCGRARACSIVRGVSAVGEVATLLGQRRAVRGELRPLVGPRTSRELRPLPGVGIASGVRTVLPLVAGGGGMHSRDSSFRPHRPVAPCRWHTGRECDVGPPWSPHRSDHDSGIPLNAGYGTQTWYGLVLPSTGIGGGTWSSRSDRDARGTLPSVHATGRLCHLGGCRHETCEAFGLLDFGSSLESTEAALRSTSIS